MRILILDTSPIRRGAQVFGLELAAHLKTLGHVISRVYLFQATAMETLPVGTADLVLPFREDSFLEKFPTFQPKLLKSIRKKVESFQPQVIICNGSKTLKYGALLRILTWDKRTKLVGRFIDDAVFWNPRGIRKEIYSYWINRFDALVGVSQNSLNSAIQHYGFKKPTTVIHRVFDPKKFINAPNQIEARKSLGLGDQDEIILFLGNLTSQKRPDRFIEIVAKLSTTRPKLKALIVGDGPLRKELENKITSTKYNVQRTKNDSQETDSISNEENNSTPEAYSSDIEHRTSRIFFCGYRQDVSPYLAAADLLVLTSDTEGLPGVVLEAAFFEVPSVASEVGGIRECLLDGETGYLIPERTVDSFCKKINYLLGNPKVMEEMGEKAKDFVGQNFRMEKVAKQYLDFFEGLIR